MVEQDTSPAPGSADVRLRALSALLAGLALCAGATSASAAAGWRTSCESIAQGLRSVEIPVEALSVDSVEYLSNSAAPLEADPAQGNESMAPMLYLTPRVVHILQSIFTDEQVAAQPGGGEVPATVRAANDSAAARPVSRDSQAAGHGSDEDEFAADIFSGALPGALQNSQSLPRLQRQMYRTDI